MQTINLGWFARMALALQPLTTQGLEEPGLAMDNVNRAWSFLLYLANSEMLQLSLDASRPVVWQIMAEIGKILEANLEDQADVIKSVKSNIYDLASKLSVLLDGDLAHQSVYNVLPKRAYSIRILINDATRLLSEEARNSISSEERYNIEQAGRCLAFEVPTAAVFPFGSSS